MAKYAPTIDVALVSYNEDERTYRDRTTGQMEVYKSRLLHWVAPSYGIVGSCPVPERLSPVCNSIGPSPDLSRPNARLVLSSFVYDHGSLKITLDDIEMLTN